MQSCVGLKNGVAVCQRILTFFGNLPSAGNVKNPATQVFKPDNEVVHPAKLTGFAGLFRARKGEGRLKWEVEIVNVSVDR